MNNESVGKKIVEALKKQAENIDMQPSSIDFGTTEEVTSESFFDSKDDFFAEPKKAPTTDFFDDIESNSNTSSLFDETPSVQTIAEPQTEGFEIPANITVLRKLIAQLPSGVSRHTGAQIIKQTMEALGISMKSVLQDAQQVQENLKVTARECQGTIQEYKKQILALEKQSQSYQKQYSALNDLISLFIQTTK